MRSFTSGSLDPPEPKKSRSITFRPLARSTTTRTTFGGSYGNAFMPTSSAKSHAFKSSGIECSSTNDAFGRSLGAALDFALGSSPLAHTAGAAAPPLASAAPGQLVLASAAPGPLVLASAAASALFAAPRFFALFSANSAETPGPPEAAASGAGASVATCLPNRPIVTSPEVRAPSKRSRRSGRPRRSTDLGLGLFPPTAAKPGLNDAARRDLGAGANPFFNSAIGAAD
mmetsp:Transcript_5135/g.18754  ORF Transcript_5135/g.18754 Transcript_5135/m.18754 type:complete len:229 (-) Transcript_5135:46-732(-)